MIDIPLSRLRRIPRFSKLPDEILEWISVRAEKLVIAKGTVLIREDEEARFVFTIKTGKIKLTKTGSDGNE